MLNDLVYFDNSIVGRYRTVERNIKSKSNSFYDSFLDLLENTIKRILVLEEIPYDAKYTCGTLLREKSIEKYFKKDIGIDDYTYSKCIDYIAKVNKHKHFNEHMINIDMVVTYMKVYYNLVSSYLKHKGKDVSPFDVDHFSAIYGLTERENKELKNEVGRLKDDLETLALENKLSNEDNETYKALVSAQEVEKLSLEDQNIELRNQLSKLKDIKINTIETKLNKALELLYNLTDSVVESRAIGIAVGKSITGEDITKTSFMKDAVEIVKKKESVFAKLDKQGKDISDLSQKFSDMDVESLYKAAEKARKDKNNQAAIKYYEQLCALRPNDWKPAYYVGLLKCYGSWNNSEYWHVILFSFKNAFVSALKTINKERWSLEEISDDVKDISKTATGVYKQFLDSYKNDVMKNKYTMGWFGDSIFDLQSVLGETIDCLKPFAEIDDVANSIIKMNDMYVDSIRAAKGFCCFDLPEEQFKEWCGSHKVEYKPLKEKPVRKN